MANNVPSSTALRFLLVALLGCVASPADGLPLTPAALDAGPISADEGWQYRPGGDQPLTESAWRRLDDTAGDAGERLPDWPGIGRFRLEVDVAPELVGQPIGLRLDHFGSSDLFLEGQHVASSGRVDADPRVDRPRSPKGRLHIVAFDRPGPHRVELLFANHAAADPLFGSWLTYRRGGGFHLVIDRPSRAISTFNTDRIAGLALNLGLGCFALAFALLHGLLYLYHRGQPGNLWFALFAFFLAANGGQHILVDWLPVGLWGDQALWLINGPIAVALVLSAINFLESVLDGPTHPAVRWLRWAAIPVLISYLGLGLLPIPSLLQLWFMASVPVAVLLMVTAWRRRAQSSDALAVSAVGWAVVILAESIKTHVGPVAELLLFASGLILVFGGASLFLARRIAHDYRATERLAQTLEERVQERTIDLRRSEREARAASRAKSAFLATMSHEIRTPMNAILGFAQLLARADLPIREREMVSTLERSAASLLRLIGDILDLSRVEAGHLELDDQAVWIEGLVEEVVDLFAVQAREQGIELAGSVDPELPKVILGDPVRLRQILVNLVGNALKFTSEGGVALTAKADGEALWIAVRDTGVGIPASRRDALFEPFVQADGSAVRRHSGAGLGLAICRELATMMGGTIGVDTTPGGGSTFHVRLPLRPASPEDVQAARNEAVEVSVSAPTRRLQILLAEDNPVNQEVVALMVEDLGHRLDMVDHGEAVFDALDNHDYDLLLLDLHMPDLDGIEVARRLRQSGQSLPIVALTASVLPEDRARCRAVGMDDFISKPVRLETLQEVFEGLPAE